MAGPVILRQTAQIGAGEGHWDSLAGRLKELQVNTNFNSLNVNTQLDVENQMAIVMLLAFLGYGNRTSSLCEASVNYKCFIVNFE